MPQPQIERKFIDFKDLAISEEGPGTISGYRAVFSEIDEGGDLIVKGFFADSIDEYLEAGFSAHSHEWAFKDAVGFPISAKEDDHGFLVESQFHGTSDAQDIRQKAVERFKAKKRVGFSFGYSVKDKSYIEAKDYKEQLPLFIKPERLQANLIKAQKFDRIRILKKGEVIEDSIVTSPMNKLAMATGMKSELPDQIKSLIADHGEEAIIREVNAGLDPEQAYLKGITGTESFESFESVVSTIEKFTQKMQGYHDIRLKDGRVLSTSNRTKVQACYDALGVLLAESEPKPKEKGLDVEALRTQSLRLEGHVMSTLAQFN